MELNLIVEEEGVRDSELVIYQKLTRCNLLGFKHVALSVVIDVDKSTDIPAPPEVKTSNQLKIYTRLTVKVSETLQLYKLSKNKITAKYNLFSLDPKNAKILQYISIGSVEFDILSLELSEKLNHSLFKTNFKVLEERGVCIEINYGPAQLGSSLRRNIICNGQNLVEKTSKNIILSNGVSDSFRLRGPKDAKSLGTLFLMPSHKCHDAVHTNGMKALNLSKYRHNPASSAIELVEEPNND